MVAHVLGPAGAPPPNPCPPTAAGELLYAEHGWGLHVCPACGALIPADMRTVHSQWHQLEAARVEQGILRRARLRGDRHAH